MLPIVDFKLSNASFILCIKRDFHHIQTLTQDDIEPLCLLGNGVFLRDWRFVCTTTGSCSSHFSLITSLSLSSSPLNTGWIYAF